MLTLVVDSYANETQGWGCDGNAVEEIVKELKARMKVRGDTGQIVRTEYVGIALARNLLVRMLTSQTQRQILKEVKELRVLLEATNAKLDRVIGQEMSRA